MFQFYPQVHGAQVGESCALLQKKSPAGEGRAVENLLGDYRDFPEVDMCEKSFEELVLYFTRISNDFDICSSDEEPFFLCDEVFRVDEDVIFGGRKRFI